MSFPDHLVLKIYVACYNPKGFTKVRYVYAENITKMAKWIIAFCSPLYM